MTATDARIVGFVGEPSPGLLTCHRPVIEVEGHRYAALREDWAFADDDLSQLTDQTRRYVRLGIDNEDPAKPG
ncbi:MAG: hypothetical protein LBK59_05015, partial [Bifidobacteriaceae bacterium]|nr:hypothetical protein [Bifidobacteriaceae bacterium]